MKNLSLLPIVLAFSIRVYSQTSFENAIYFYSQHSSSSDIIETSAHEYVMGVTISEVAHIQDAYIYKLDPSGNFMWRRKLNTGGVVTRIMEMGDSSYLLSKIGTHYSTIVGDDLPYATFAKSDTAANLVWERHLGDSVYGFKLFDIIQNKNHGFTCVGQMDSANYSWSLITQYDFYGNINFQRRYFSSVRQVVPYSYHLSNALVNLFEHTDSTFYVLSSVQNQPAIIHLGVHGDSLSTYLIPDSISGANFNQIEWFGGTDNYVKALIGTRDTASAQLIKIFYSTLNISNGNITNKIITNVTSFMPAANNATIAAGYCMNTFNTVNPVIEKRDSSENVIWSRCLQPNYKIYSNMRMKYSSDGGILFTGSIDSTNYGSYESIYCIKIDSSGNVFTSVPGIEISGDELQIFPNPATEFITINISSLITQLKIYNYSGEEVLSTKNVGNVLDIHSLKPGIYFAEIMTTEGLNVLKFAKSNN